MDVGSLKLLEQLVALGSGSLLQYVSEAFPYSADPRQAAFHRVLALAHEERDAVARLSRSLQKMHVRLPKTGSYPSHFTTMNFVTLDYLVPKLVAENEKEIAQVAAALTLLEDAQARDFAQTYHDMKCRHLEVLKNLASGQTPAGAA